MGPRPEARGPRRGRLDPSQGAAQEESAAGSGVLFVGGRRLGRGAGAGAPRLGRVSPPARPSAPRAAPAPPPRRPGPPAAGAAAARPAEAARAASAGAAEAAAGAAGRDELGEVVFGAEQLVEFGTTAGRDDLLDLGRDHGVDLVGLLIGLV